MPRQPTTTQPRSPHLLPALDPGCFRCSNSVWQSRSRDVPGHRLRGHRKVPQPGARRLARRSSRAVILVSHHHHCLPALIPQPAGSPRGHHGPVVLAAAHAPATTRPVHAARLADSRSAKRTVSPDASQERAPVGVDVKRRLSRSPTRSSLRLTQHNTSAPRPYLPRCRR